MPGVPVETSHSAEPNPLHLLVAVRCGRLVNLDLLPDDRRTGRSIQDSSRTRRQMHPPIAGALRSRQL